MCGIAGFLGPWSGQLAEAMVAALRHRGPDDEGCQFDAAAGLALGHTRLSIIDLTQAAHQPMSTADGRYTISFNGEIYNYRSLRAVQPVKALRPIANIKRQQHGQGFEQKMRPLVIEKKHQPEHDEELYEKAHPTQPSSRVASPAP